MSQQPGVSPEPGQSRQHSARDTTLLLVAILLSLVSAAIAAIILLPFLFHGSASAWVAAERTPLAATGIGCGLLALVLSVVALVMRRSRLAVRALAVLLALAVTVVSSGTLLGSPANKHLTAVATATPSPTPARLTMLTSPMPYPVPSMVAGPDGAVWYPGRFGVQRITPIGDTAQYPVPNFNRLPVDMITDPNGSFWMGEIGTGLYEFGGFTGTDAIAHVSPQGVISESLLPQAAEQSVSLDLASDTAGGVWYSRNLLAGGGGATCRIGRVSSTGKVTEFPDLGSGEECVPGYSPAVTPGGDAWVFTVSPRALTLVRVSSSGTSRAVFTTLTFNLSDRLTVGPDHNVWFSYAPIQGRKPAGSTVYRVMPNGTVSQFVLPSNTEALNLTNGLDGAIWYVGVRSDGQDVIGQITMSGAVTQVPFTTSAHPTTIFQVAPIGVQAAKPIIGPDGNVWYASTTTQGRQIVGSSIVRVTPRGVVTVFSVPVPGAQITSLIAGPGHAIWFATLVTTGSPPNQSYSSEIGAVVMGA